MSVEWSTKLITFKFLLQVYGAWYFCMQTKAHFFFLQFWIFNYANCSKLLERAGLHIESNNFILENKFIYLERLCFRTLLLIHSDLLNPYLDLFFLNSQSFQLAYLNFLNRLQFYQQVSTLSYTSELYRVIIFWRKDSEDEWMPFQIIILSKIRLCGYDFTW